MEISESDEKKRQRMWNPKTLALLKEKGANLSKPHDITNVFYPETTSAAKRLRRLLVAEGLEITQFEKIDEPVEPSYWAIHFIVKLIPTQRALDDMTDKCVELAAAAGTDYDGWYTEV